MQDNKPPLKGLPFPDPDAPKPLPSKYTPPIDISKVTNEKDVKSICKKLLDHFGWFWWMPGASGFGTQGVHDFCCLKDGVFLTVETKFGKNTPTPVQRSFARHVMANSAIALVVNESNIDHLFWFLESFDASVARRLGGQKVEADHGSRMLNALAALTDGW